MKKKEFYRIQAEAFKDYALKFEIKNGSVLLSVFDEWAESKDFADSDKKRIWKVARARKWLKKAKGKKLIGIILRLR